MDTPQTISLVVGLGNPGARYAHTYHNAGAAALRAFADRTTGTNKRTALFEYARRGELTLVWPRTFMNESGAAVARALAFFKVPRRQLLVVHDDSDLPIGTVRLAFGRGAAGHHGVESIIAALKTADFWRLRIGVRPLATAGAVGKIVRRKAGAFILRPMHRSNAEAIYRAAAGAMEKLMRNESPHSSDLISESGSVTP